VNILFHNVCAGNPFQIGILDEVMAPWSRAWNVILRIVEYLNSDVAVPAMLADVVGVSLVAVDRCFGVCRAVLSVADDTSLDGSDLLSLRR
jgi:hypothetical protein